MSSEVSSESSINGILGKVQKFQKRSGSKIFMNGGDIARADYDIRHNVGKGEMGVYLDHVNGAKMSMIFRTLDKPLSVLIVLEQNGTTYFSIPVSDKEIFIDWVCLLGEIFYHRSLDEKNVSVLMNDSM